MTAVAQRSWCVVVPHHPRGARQARHRLESDLGPLLDAPTLADVITVAAELIGNAVRHATPLPGGVIRVAWRLLTPTGVEVRVTDGGGPTLPTARAVGDHSPDGRGLAIVGAIADRWGVDHDGLGQSVWAHLS